MAERSLPLQLPPSTLPASMVYHDGVWADPVGVFVACRLRVNDPLIHFFIRGSPHRCRGSGRSCCLLQPLVTKPWVTEMTKVQSVQFKRLNRLRVWLLPDPITKRTKPSRRQANFFTPLNIMLFVDGSGSSRVLRQPPVRVEVTIGREMPGKSDSALS